MGQLYLIDGIYAPTPSAYADVMTSSERTRVALALERHLGRTLTASEYTFLFMAEAYFEKVQAEKRANSQPAKKKIA